MFRSRKFYALSEPVRYHFPRLPLWLYLIVLVVLAYVGLNVVSLLDRLPMTPTSLVAQLVAGFC